MNFAEVLRSYRTILDLTQDELADAFGIDRATYTAYESEMLPPPTEFVNEVIECLMLNKEYFNGKADSPGFIDLITGNLTNESTASETGIRVVSERPNLSPHRSHTPRWEVEYMLADSNKGQMEKIKRLYTKDKTYETVNRKDKMTPEMQKEFDERMEELRQIRLQHEIEQDIKKTDELLIRLCQEFHVSPDAKTLQQQTNAPFTHDEIRLLVKYRLLKKKYSRENQPLSGDDFLKEYLKDKHK